MNNKKEKSLWTTTKYDDPIYITDFFFWIKALKLLFKCRNIITIGIVGAVYGEKKAWAGARRAAPPPTDQEKKDPNISAVQAKVLASRKRKEAMKQAMAKQRERGKKVIEQPSNSSPSPQSEPKPEPEPELEPMPQ